MMSLKPCKFNNLLQRNVNFSEPLRFYKGQAPSREKYIKIERGHQMTNGRQTGKEQLKFFRIVSSKIKVEKAPSNFGKTNLQ